MRKILVTKAAVLLCVMCGAVIAALPVSAQQQVLESNITDQDTAPVIRDVEGLRLKVVEQAQDPETKEIILDVIIYSQIRSDRVQVNWTVTGAGVLASPTNQISLRMDPGQVRTLQVRVKPLARGTTTVNLRVEAFEAQGTYLASATQRIYSLEDGTRLPRTQTHWNLMLIFTIKEIAKFLLVVFGVWLIINAGYGVFKRWYNRRELELEAQLL